MTCSVSNFSIGILQRERLSFQILFLSYDKYVGYDILSTDCRYKDKYITSEWHLKIMLLTGFWRKPRWKSCRQKTRSWNWENIPPEILSAWEWRNRSKTYTAFWWYRGKGIFFSTYLVIFPNILCSSYASILTGRLHSLSCYLCILISHLVLLHF